MKGSTSNKKLSKKERNALNNLLEGAGEEIDSGSIVEMYTDPIDELSTGSIVETGQVPPDYSLQEKMVEKDYLSKKKGKYFLNKRGDKMNQDITHVKEMFYFRRNKQNVPVETVYAAENTKPKSEDTRFVRSSVSCNVLDFPPKKNVGRFFTQFYLNKERFRIDLEEELKSYLEESELEKVYGREEKDGKRVIKETDKEKRNQILKGLKEEVKEIVQNYEDMFSDQMEILAYGMDVMHHDVVQDILMKETKVRAGRKDKHVEFFGEDGLTDYEKKVLLYRKEEKTEKVDFEIDEKIVEETEE